MFIIEKNGENQRAWRDTGNGGVAQLGEHLPCKQGVKSSNLSVSICSEIAAGGISTALCTLKTEYRKDPRKERKDIEEGK